MFDGRSQARLTVPPEALVTRRSVGGVHFAVVAATGSLGADTLPALSTATTVSEYVVSDFSPPIWVPLGVVVACWRTPSTRATYHFSPTSSVEPVNEIVTVSGVTARTRTFDGAVGGCASAAPATGAATIPSPAQMALTATSRRANRSLRPPFNR